MGKVKGYDGGRRKRRAKRRRIWLGLLGVLLVMSMALFIIVLIKVIRPDGTPDYSPELLQNVPVQAQVTQEETWAVTEAPEFGELADTDNPTVNAANRLARMYDYDAAIAMVQSIGGYQNDEVCTNAIAVYEDLKSQCELWTDYGKITHIFFHSLIVDEDRAYASEKRDDYNKVMTTVEEFKKIIQSMYERDYVLISLHKIAKMEMQPDGTEKMVKQEIWLPKGKKPFVLSEDDVCYYEYMTGHGFASRLLIDENGKVVNEYTDAAGNVSYGSYDVLPILEDFIEEHPDFSYRGSKGILAFTGYDGVLGYRTSDFWYTENCDYYISNPKNDEEKVKEHTSPNLNIEQDKQTARQVAQAIRDLGWELASHSWGHPDLKAMKYENFVWDTDMWEREVEPIIGDTDIILYPLGADVGEWMPESYGADNPRYVKLKQAGFDYFCNVDGAQYWVQINEDNFRQGRRNMDGFMMYKQMLHPEKVATSDLFDAEAVFSKKRPTPVPGVQ